MHLLVEQNITEYLEDVHKVKKHENKPDVQDADDYDGELFLLYYATTWERYVLSVESVKRCFKYVARWTWKEHDGIAALNVDEIAMRCWKKEMINTMLDRLTEALRDAAQYPGNGDGDGHPRFGELVQCLTDVEIRVRAEIIGSDSHFGIKG
jgi:hypothetical protein